MRNEARLPQVFTTADAVASGFTQEQIEWAVARDRWRRLRRGAFCVTETWTRASPERRHVLFAEAVMRVRTQGGAYAFSHVTAAAVHGLPVARRLLERVTLTVDPTHSAGTRYAGDYARQVAPLTSAEIVYVRGLLVTSPARTVADCLRHVPAIDAVPIADAALHRRLTGLDDVREVLTRQGRWPYAGVAAATLPFVDGRRESPLESRSAVVMRRYALPAPEPQVKIYDHAGRFVGVVDFAWLKRGVVGEADGHGKYADADDPVAIFDAEKDRQARLEALGLLVVRWNGSHLIGNPPVLVQRLGSALEPGSGRRFTGRAA